MIPSLYIHIPFCRRRCLYCDFYSTVYDGSLASSYIDCLCDQIEEIEQPAFSTIYIGGGTPTVLSEKLLDKLMKSLGRKASEECEFTIEANPESLDRSMTDLLLRHGINRLSIGVQSLYDRKLKKLGRVHNSARAVESVITASKLGLHNISIDLIYGVSGESLATWQGDLEEATGLPVKHVSAYSLTYEKGTPLYEALSNKSIEPLEDEIVGCMYELAIDKLSLRGIKQYEVSSFAKEGYKCRHNLNYWENGEYMGLGASAVSYIDGVRAKNIADLAGYVRRYDESKSLIESSEKLSPIRRAKETAAIKIRTKDGIDFEWFKSKAGYDLRSLEGKVIEDLISRDLIKYLKDGDSIKGIRLKRKGFLFCDSVSSALL